MQSKTRENIIKLFVVRHCLMINVRGSAIDCKKNLSILLLTIILSCAQSFWKMQSYIQSVIYKDIYQTERNASVVKNILAEMW